MPTALSELQERLAEIADLGHAGRVLYWDQMVMMPPGGASRRAEAASTLARIRHERFIDPATGSLLERAAGEVADLPEDSDAASLVRTTQRAYEKARRVPASLASARASAASAGHEVWVAARRADDFKLFEPYLRRNLELTREYIDCFEGYDAAYDVLLDDFDPESTSAHVRTLFDELKGELVPLIAQLRERDVDVTPLHVSFPLAAQRQLSGEVIRRMGFSEDAWRFDDAVHPFQTSFSSADIRVTTRYEADYFPMALYGAMHESGHGLYEHGIPSALERSPLARPASLAVHESQSRMWENMVGRGREFTGFLTPRIVELSGGALNGVSSEAIFRALNAVQPSPIRVEADETTYAIHVILRFELEQELVDGKLSVGELPEVWKTRMRDYLGIEISSDAEGVLQDVHWSEGLIGYFPTYALGNLIAGQLWEQLHHDLPELDAQLAAGEFGELRGWLREHVHRHGGKFTSRELLERIVGGPIAVAPFVAYLKAKLSGVYGLTLA